MLKIRLRKPGKSVKGRHHYKIVVCDSKTPRESKFVEQIGYYDPSNKLLKLNLERYESWKGKGAQPTETVANLFKKCKRENKSS